MKKRSWSWRALRSIKHYEAAATQDFLGTSSRESDAWNGKNTRDQLYP